jgi:hypothetical protein
LLVGCQSKAPDARPAEEPQNDREFLLRWKLFATAQQVLTGKLKILVFDSEARDFRVEIGGKAAALGYGYIVSESELQRLRKLSGTDVIAAVGEKPPYGWWVESTGDDNCIGPRDQWQWEAPAAAFRMLNEDQGWAAKAMAAENGKWNDTISRCWREGSAWPIMATLAEASEWEQRLTLAADIAGWYVRTMDTVLPDIPGGTAGAERRQQQPIDVREQALLVALQTLEVPLIKPLKNPPLDKPEEVAKSIWMMTRMVTIGRQYVREQGAAKR